MLGRTRSSTAARTAHALAVAGVEPFYGTPCGILAPLYAELMANNDMTTVVREDNAVGMAAGASLAGRRPAVLMQNSGLGQAVNALASLTQPYAISMLLIVSLRGTDEDKTPENFLMGQLTRPILRGLGVRTETLDADSATESVDCAVSMMREGGGAVALLVPPSAFGWTP